MREQRGSGTDSYYRRMIAGKDVPDRYIDGYIEYLFERKESDANERAVVCRRNVLEFLKIKGYAGPDVPEREAVKVLLACKEKVDWLRAPERATRALFSKLSVADRMMMGCVRRSGDVDYEAVATAVLWTNVEGARLTTGNDNLDIDEAVKVAEQTIRISQKEYIERACEWCRKAPWSVVFARKRTRKIGTSLVLPVAEECYFAIRQGIKPIFECDSQDILPSSRFIVLLAIAQRSPKLGGPRRATFRLFTTMLSQIAALTQANDLPSELPIHVLSFAPFKLSEERLVAGGFRPTGTKLAKTQMPVYERLLGESKELSDSDRQYRMIVNFWSRICGDVPPTIGR